MRRVLNRANQPFPPSDCRYDVGLCGSAIVPNALSSGCHGSCDLERRQVESSYRRVADGPTSRGTRMRKERADEEQRGVVFVTVVSIKDELVDSSVAAAMSCRWLVVEGLYACDRSLPQGRREGRGIEKRRPLGQRDHRSHGGNREGRRERTSRWTRRRGDGEETRGERRVWGYEAGEGDVWEGERRGRGRRESERRG